MKALINSLKRTHWFKASLVFFTCLLFLVFPSCQKDELEQVIIRTQVWMAENLKTTRFNDRTKIPLVSEDITWNALSTSDAEWYDLILYFDPSAKLTVMPVYESLTAGNQIKETGTTHWTETDIYVTNLSGFTALPEGSRDSYLRKFQIYWNKRLLVEFFSYRAFIYFCVGS